MLANPTITTDPQEILPPGKYSYILIDNSSDTDVEICFGSGDLENLDGIRIPSGEHRLFVNNNNPTGPLGLNGVSAVHRGSGDKTIAINT